jgi:hypothetical protein
MARASKIKLVVAVLGWTAIVGLLLRAIFAVATGHGSDTYISAYGMRIHWVSVLALAALLLVALLGGVVVRWWQLRDDRTIRRLLRKSGRNPGVQVRG